VTDHAARERRKLHKKAFKEAERAREIAACPLPLLDLQGLLEAVTRLVLDDQGRNLGDHTHRFTRFSLRARSMTDVAGVVSFLRSNGFFCDCEVALNLGSWLAENDPSGRMRH
jgi:uncharacterized protein DUF2695